MQGKKIISVLLTCMLILVNVAVSSATWAATSDGQTITKAIGKKVTVIMETSEGTVKKRINSGSTIILPPDVNGNGYTFLGWSTISKQSCNPMYQAYEKLKVTRNIHLYPVKYKWSQEPDISVDRLADNVNKYSRIIFVGDSRTVMLEGTLQRQCDSSVFNKVGFVCKTGQGLAWMMEEGEKMLLNKVGRTDKNTKPVAVIFNLGVNDLIHRNGTGINYDSIASEYASYMNRLSRKLTARNCELFYMSVNPCNTAMKTTRKESEIRGFNSRLKQRLNGNFTWINSYSYLMKYGYTTRCEFRGNADDGLHYSMKTYKRIYAYAIKRIR